MRRKMLFLIVLGLAGTVAGIPPLAEVAQAATETTITLDVAWDCRTWNYTRGLPLTEIVRGDGFIMSGKIFPAGTLQSGTPSNDPNDPGSIGDWVGRGTSTATLAEHLAHPQEPGVFWTQYFMLKDGMLVSEGWAAPAGANEAALVGATRAFRGASGEVSTAIMGTNITGCPNARVTITFEKQAPK